MRNITDIMTEYTRGDNTYLVHGEILTMEVKGVEVMVSVQVTYVAKLVASTTDEERWVVQKRYVKDQAIEALVTEYQRLNNIN